MDEHISDVAVPHVIWRTMGGIQNITSLATTMERLGVSVISITNMGMSLYFFGIFGKISCTEEELANINTAIDAEVNRIKKQKK